MNKKTYQKSITLFLLVLLLVGTTCPISAKKRKGLRKGPNISLNITNKKKNLPNTYFNLGLVSNFTNLDGFGLNVVSSIVHRQANGVQASGFLNIAGLRSSGLQAAGLANLSGIKAHGFRAAGLLNISGRNSYGVQIAGIGNVAGENQRGFLLSGLMNLSSCETSGLQIAGLANISGENQKGIALAGLMNVNGSNMTGVQLTSLLNVSGKENKGVQIAGLGNVTVQNKGLQLSALANYSEENRGVQLSLANVCNQSTKGVQVGLFNLSTDSCAHQVGIINLKPTTRVQLIVSGGNANLFNLSVRFKNHHVFTQLGGGIQYKDFTDKLSVSAFYRAGLIFPLITNRLDISGDLSYYHIETLDNKKIGCPARLYALQPRINLEYHPMKKFGIFVSGGYGWTRTYKGNHSFRNQPVFEAGIILF